LNRDGNNLLRAFLVADIIIKIDIAASLDNALDGGCG
jgi:hypothetical protein